MTCWPLTAPHRRHGRELGTPRTGFKCVQSDLGGVGVGCLVHRLERGGKLLVVLPRRQRRRATKLIWLALRNIAKNWKMPAITWRAAKNQFAILFAERFTAHL